MGIRIIIAGILLITLNAGCKTAKQTGSTDYSTREEFVKAYKVAFICGCLNEGTKEGFKDFMTRSNDLGLFTEAQLISPERVIEADSIGRAFSKQIKPLNYADAGDKIPYVSRCITYALGKQVDSLAQKRFKASHQ